MFSPRVKASKIIIFALLLIPADVWAGEIEGVVVGRTDGANGKLSAIAQRRVRVCQARQRNNCVTAYTDHDGSFLVGKLRGGKYTVYVDNRKGGPASQTVTVDDRGVTRVRLIMP